MRWTMGPMAASLLLGLALTGCAGGMDGTADSKKDANPDYMVASAKEEFEIRDYKPRAVAMTTLRGSYRQSVEQGYINLERYFLGANAVPEAMKMDVPIMVREDPSGGWTTIFPLPRDYRAETAPRPNDERIRVVEVPARRVAVLKFPGALDDSIMTTQSAKLKAWLDGQGIAYRDDWTMAMTDLAWVPARWRTNEIQVTLK